MSRRVRIAVLAPALAAFGVLLGWGFAGLPDFGHYLGPYGDVLNRAAVPERHVTNVVTATVFDYRGLDTMGEEFILFASVVGVILLLRGQAHQAEARDTVRSDAVHLVGLLMVGPVVVLGLWIAAFGFVTPGGGFQGGVALAGAVLLVYLAGSHAAWSRISTETALDPLKGTGAGGYVVIGLAALISGLPFLTNLLDPGRTGTLLSGGSAAFVNWSVALAVTAANLIMFHSFLEAYIKPVAARQP